MRPHKPIFILPFVFLFSIIGCEKRQLPGVSEPPAQEKDKQQLENQETEYLLKELRQKNPFRPDHARGIVYPEILKDTGLKGIIWDSQRPLAVFGDSVVGEGDYIDNKKIIKIDKDAVTLDVNGRKEILRLEEAPE